MKALKKVVSAAAIVFILLGAQYGHASIAVTIDGWRAAEEVQVTDKIWTFIDTDLGDETKVEFDELSPGRHRLTINSNFFAVNSPDESPFYLKYSIEIDTQITPDLFFSTVFVNSDVAGGAADAAVVTKKIYTNENWTSLLDTIESVNGTPDNTADFRGDRLRKLWIWETFDYSEGNELTTSTNVFNQAPVPEPASLAIWSLLAVGGAAAAASRRRRRGRWSDESRVAINRVIERN